jgi:hypothetical protein
MYGPHFDIAEVDVVSAFETIFDIAVMQPFVDEANSYTQRDISKIISTFTFRSRIWKWEDVTMDNMYAVLGFLC